MEEYEYIYKDLLVDSVESDPDQPRKDFGLEGDETNNRFLASIRDRGIQEIIKVSEIEKDRYRIIDGHRRFKAAQKLGYATVPCRIYPKMKRGELESLRFELQNNRRSWRPPERAEALERIKEDYNFKSGAELALHLHTSDTNINNSLQIFKQNRQFSYKLEKRDFGPSYYTEFIRLKSKLRKIKKFEIDDIIDILIEKIEKGVIKSSKEIRKIGRVFKRKIVNVEELYVFLSDIDMKVDELDLKTEISGFSLLLIQTVEAIKLKKRNGVYYSSKEDPLIKELHELTK